MDPVRRGTDGTQIRIGERPCVCGWRLKCRRFAGKLRLTELNCDAVLAQPSVATQVDHSVTNAVFDEAAALTALSEVVEW